MLNNRLLKASMSVAILSFAALTGNTSASESKALLQSAHQEQRQQQSHNNSREAGFHKNEKQLQSIKNQLASERAVLQSEADTLSVTFSENESSLQHVQYQPYVYQYTHHSRP